jgi:hypothetical protein
MADDTKYIAKTDCLVFGHYRTAGEEFLAPEWKTAYNWPMPDFLEVISTAGGEAPKKPVKVKAAQASGDLG